MPKVYLPFPDDHKHAGKYFEGYLPLGDFERTCRLAGALTEKPDDKLIVTNEQTILAETEEATAVFKDLGGSPQVKRTVKLHHDRVVEFLNVGNIIKARASLAALELEVQKAGGIAGGMAK